MKYTSSASRGQIQNLIVFDKLDFRHCKYIISMAPSAGSLMWHAERHAPERFTRVINKISGVGTRAIPGQTRPSIVAITRVDTNQEPVIEGVMRFARRSKQYVPYLRRPKNSPI